MGSYAEDVGSYPPFGFILLFAGEHARVFSVVLAEVFLLPSKHRLLPLSIPLVMSFLHTRSCKAVMHNVVI